MQKQGELRENSIRDSLAPSNREVALAMELLEAKLSQTVLLAEIIRLKNELHEARRTNE